MRTRQATCSAGVGVFLFGLTLSACTDGGGEAQLRSILASDRDAHLGVDAARLAAHLADTVFVLDAGQIRVQSRQEIEDTFRTHFEGATYHVWEDVGDPEIRIAEDGSMAWVARRVRVDREGPRFGGGVAREQFESAWTATYRWAADAWRMTSVTSSFAENPSAAQIVAGARRAIDDGALGSLEFARFEASASGPGGGYRVTVQSTVGGAARLEFSTGFSAAITRTDGWARFTPAETPAALSDTLETFVRGHDLMMNALYPDRRYGALRVAGEQPFAEVPAIRLEGVDALGAPIEFYYSKRDTIPLGFRVVDHVRGRGPVTTQLFDWQSKDGVLLPTRARFIQEDEVFDYEIDLIETSASVDDRTFQPGF